MVLMSGDCFSLEEAHQQIVKKEDNIRLHCILFHITIGYYHI